MIELIKNFPSKRLRSIEDHVEFNKKLDNFFGISFTQTEKDLDTSLKSNYKGEVDSDGLNTFYADILSIESMLGETNHIVDVGSGYCRVGLFLAIRNSSLKITCIESQPSRLKAAIEFKERYNLNNLEILNEDISNVSCLHADSFFFYFPVCDQVRSFLLNNIDFSSSSIIAIESHGDFFDFLTTDFPGLEVVDEKRLVAPRHNPYIKKWRLLNKDLFNKIDKHTNDICDQLSHTNIVEFSYVNDSISSVIIEKISSLGEVRIEFDNGDIVLLKKLNKCYFELYQLESNNPRRVYKYNQIKRLLL